MYKLFTDGGSRGNPGPAALGAILFQDEEIIDFVGTYLGERTNNYAEYNALIEGLKLAIGHDIKELECFLDSELVVKQVNGQYKVRHEDIIPLNNAVQNLKKQFKTVTFTHVLRDKNKLGDKLVNTVLDAVNN